MSYISDMNDKIGKLKAENAELKEQLQALAQHIDEAVHFELADVIAVKREDLLAMSGDVCPSTGRSEMECLLSRWLKGNDIPMFRKRLYVATHKQSTEVK